MGLPWGKVVVAGLVLLFVLSLFPKSEPRVTKRFTVEVQTPDGLRTGSSVVSMQASQAPWWFPAFDAGSVRIRGEAVAVDLGNGRFLFVPLYRVQKMKRITHTSGITLVDLFRSSRLDDEGKLRKVGQIRMMRFSSLSDPLSGKEVDPANLGDAFGQGYRLQTVRVQDTDDEVTLPNTVRFGALFAGLSALDRISFTQPL